TIVGAVPNFTHEQAAEQLRDAWTLEHNARLADWATQEAQDAADAAEAEQQRQEHDAERRRQEELEAENERREEEKKKPKMKGFNASKSVGDAILARPSQFAIQKLRAFEYCPLWYFTPEGCKDATEFAKSVDDDSYGFTKVEQILTLKSVASSRASKNAVQDKDLTWRQFDLGNDGLLNHACKAGWRPEHLQALSTFFVSISTSELRTRPLGEETLLLYQDRVRREWHDSLKMDDDPFNIALLSETLLRSIGDEVHDAARNDALIRVSSLYPKHIIPVSHSPSHPHAHFAITSTLQQNHASPTCLHTTHMPPICLPLPHPSCHPHAPPPPSANHTLPPLHHLPPTV
ncbi:hypothetical protein BV22DRAFT_1026403, partial [Leucogyrophana mollusca]